MDALEWKAWKQMRLAALQGLWASEVRLAVGKSGLLEPINERKRVGMFEPRPFDVKRKAPIWDRVSVTRSKDRG